MYPELCHGISTKQGGSDGSRFGFNLSHSVGDSEQIVASNRARYFSALHISEGWVAFQRQIHSDTVIEVTTPGRYENCDGLITNRLGLFLAVTIADCIPVFLYDPVKHCVAAVHSGWKGTQKNIVQKALRNLVKTYGSSPSDILCFIGPGAGVCCYTVGEEVAGLFPMNYILRRDGKQFLDLKCMIYDSVCAEGVPPASIEISPSCTICEASLFHSYRRDGSNSGRMLGIIGISGMK